MRDENSGDVVIAAIARRGLAGSHLAGEFPDDAAQIGWPAFDER